MEVVRCINCKKLLLVKGDDHEISHPEYHVIHGIKYGKDYEDDCYTSNFNGYYCSKKCLIERIETL